MWEYNTLEMLQDFVREPLSLYSARTFVEHFELNMYELPQCLRSATNLALVHGNGEYSFTSDDLMWLSCAGNVVLCRGEARNLFFLDLDCDPDDYYITSAAIIKIFNAVFPGNNQYIFKAGTALASGCKRNFADSIANNFCITQLFTFNELKEYVFFFEEALLSDEDALPYLIIQYSPQEKQPEKVPNRYREASLDYIRFLRELNAVYGVDTSQEYARYVDSFSQAQRNGISYIDACAILHLVGEANGGSSYDVLEDALEQISHLSHDPSRSLSDYPPDNNDIVFSAEAFENAEKMLKEMLGR